MKYKVGDKVVYMELDMVVANVFIKPPIDTEGIQFLLFLEGDNGALASVYSDSWHLKLKENKNG
jgi:hypothetical protein